MFEQQEDEIVVSNSVLQASSQFHKLNGATLEWRVFTVSHATLILRASGVSTEYGRLHFAHTINLRLVPVMHHARIRMATEDENKTFRSQLTGKLADYCGEEYTHTPYSLRNGRCIIECEEGVFSVWAAYLKITWHEDSKIGLEDERNYLGQPLWDMKKPLWPGGLSLPEL